jgi:hypothetical protein
VFEKAGRWKQAEGGSGVLNEVVVEKQVEVVRVVLTGVGAE